MLGWVRPAVCRASARKRARKVGSPVYSLRRTFTATSRRSTVSRPRPTRPLGGGAPRGGGGGEEGRVAGVLAAQDLHGDVAAQHRVAAPPDLTHAAGREQGVQGVAAAERAHPRLHAPPPPRGATGPSSGGRGAAVPAPRPPP